MKKIVFTIVCTLMAILVYPRVFSFVYRWVPSKWWTERIAYGQVRDPYHPRNDDYKALQKFLIKGKRPALARLGDMQKRMRHFCLIGETEDELPQLGKIAVNCSKDDKENCLLVYASFNKAYPQSLKRLVDFVAKSDFKGHILYRIGGWPNVEEGDLKLSMVPYAFKPCFFREAQRLGYKRVLWLDASILPVVSLNRIFEAIESKGYFTLSNGQIVGPFMNEQAAAGLGVSLEDCSRIPSCSAGIFGVDFSDEKAAHVISLWHQAARHPDAFFSARSDQSALSVILYQQGMLQWEPLGVLAHNNEPLSETTLFKIDRGFINMVNNLQLYPRAYFNWIRLKWEHSPSFAIEPWQVEDYRELSIETLFDRLASLGLSLTEENFLMMAEAYQGPEEFTHYLWSRKENEMPIYLILFELWRRLLPEKESLSIFCDELDNRIRSYLKDSSQDHGISNALQRLEEILEESTDLGENPHAIFASLARHVAHDLEAFLFDYISDQIDARSDLEAAELIRTFYPYMLDTLCFDFLNASLLILMDPHEGNLAFKKLLGQLAEAPDPDLLLEVAAFLIHHGDPLLFQKASKLCLENVQTEEDFQELLAIVADYCHFVEKDQAEKQIQEVFAKRLGYSAKASLKPSDPDIAFLRNILEDTEWAKI